MSDPFFGDHDYADDLDEEDGDDFAEMNCGLMANGQCGQAGTEWCDWSCPFADEARHNRRRKPKPLPLFEKAEGKP